MPTSYKIIVPYTGEQDKMKREALPYTVNGQQRIGRYDTEMWVYEDELDALKSEHTLEILEEKEYDEE